MEAQRAFREEMPAARRGRHQAQQLRGARVSSVLAALGKAVPAGEPLAGAAVRS